MQIFHNYCTSCLTLFFQLRGFSCYYEVVRAHESLLESNTVAYKRHCILYGTTGSYTWIHKTQLNTTTVGVYAHKVALLRRLRLQWLDEEDDCNDAKDHIIQCSHLCGHAHCITPEHLTLEPNKINNDRKVCHANSKIFGYLCCKGHDGYPDCIF